MSELWAGCFNLGHDASYFFIYKLLGFVKAYRHVLINVIMTNFILKL